MGEEEVREDTGRHRAQRDRDPLEERVDAIEKTIARADGARVLGMAFVGVLASAALAIAGWAYQRGDQVTAMREQIAGLERRAAGAEARGDQLGSVREQLAAQTEAIRAMSDRLGRVEQRIEQRR